MIYILDTSVVIKWFSKTDEGDLEKADWLRESYLEEKVQLLFPDLLFYELNNVLRYKPDFDSEKIKKAVATIELMEIPIQSYRQQIGTEAVKLAIQYDITVYDSYFIALAKEESFKLITANHEVYKKVSSLPWVVYLENLEI
ncbi:MAG: type II toxin-antitoxin system VapC family toxin [bacterium]